MDGPNDEAIMAKILVVYGTTEGKTRDIADAAALRMVEAGHLVKTTPVEAASARQVAASDGLFVAASVHFGRHGKAVRRFVDTNLSILAIRPTAFLSVSLHAAHESTLSEAIGYVDQFLAETGWRPHLTATAAGALRFSRYGFLKRIMMTHLARRNGLPADPSRDHDFTDDEDVARFVDQFLQLISGRAGERSARGRSNGAGRTVSAVDPEPADRT